MGSFSWLKADDLTNVSNVAIGQPFKMLIPKKFGGGFIKDEYQDYGNIGLKEDGSPKYDMYELLAFWNKDIVEELKKELKYDGEFPKMKEIDDYTDHNRCVGIDIGCYDKQMDKLIYPFKLVSVSYKGNYEDLNKCSYNDPNQGFWKTFRKKK